MNKILKHSFSSLFSKSFIITVTLLTSLITTQINAADFVGSKQCVDCHQDEFEKWQGSHHDMAMRHAKPDSVLGDFNDVKMTFRNQENRFYKKGDQYWVKIAGPDEKLTNYQIKYTFGYEPLQQYMVEFDDGRVQLIPFAWDSRPKSDGGQRWFDLYPQFNKSHQDFFWTNIGQNWNYMCADCHSTNLDKNFDVETNTYNTTFSEINVACEACHGPASDHIAWSEKAAKKPTEQTTTQHSNADTSSSQKGFDRDLTKSVKNWVYQAGNNTLQPESINDTQQTLVCAQCHSRHLQISDKDHVKADEFGERYMLSLITSELYYPDGQIYDENFVYGSFLQSEMNKKGVVCSNCHDPHSAELVMPEEVVCLQCHQANAYATTEHHKHQEDSTGAQCVNCHMPATTYMQVDDRRDHGWHSPRPDLAIDLKTPDTCLNCHEDKDSRWSDKITKTWRPTSEFRDQQQFAPAFAAVNVGDPQAASELSKIAQASSFKPIIRASALEQMANLADPNTTFAIARAVKSEDSLIRLGAANGAVNLPPAERWRLLSPLLTDKVLSVRTEAALALSPLWQSLSAEQRTALQPALNDYIEVQNFNSDRGYAHTNKGNVLAHQGKFNEAEKSYKNSMRIESYFVTAYINLAELYRLQGQDNKGLQSLLAAEKVIPDNSEIPYALGLAYIRAQQKTTAQQYFAKATKLAPSNANYFYIYGLSLESDKQDQAYQALATAYQLSGNPQYLYGLCEMKIRHQAAGIEQCLAQLSQVVPAEIVDRLKH